MSRRTPKAKRHGSGILRPMPNGKWRAEVNDACMRYRKVMDTEREARDYIDATVGALHRQAAPLDPIEIEEARRATAMLPPGVTLGDAVRHYMEFHGGIASPPLHHALEEFLREKEAAGLRERAINTLRGQCLRVARDLGDLQIADISTAALVDWLDDHGHAGTTRDNYRRALRNLFGWCVRRGYCKGNPVDGITPPRVDETMPGILTVDQVVQLMKQLSEAAPRYATAAMAFGCFAGLRPAEIGRMRWDDVQSDHIRIGSGVAKTRQQRLVAIQPAMAQWIEFCHDKGPVLPQNPRKPIERARTMVGITEWPSDAARHSFATYHYARWQDAAKTAHELGHGSTAMLFRHYRNLATPEEARRYWEIRP